MLVSFLLLQQLSEDFYYYLSCWLVLRHNLHKVVFERNCTLGPQQFIACLRRPQPHNTKMLSSRWIMCPIVQFHFCGISNLFCGATSCSPSVQILMMIKKVLETSCMILCTSVFFRNARFIKYSLWR